MERIKNKIIIIISVLFVIFCNSQQKYDLEKLVKQGLENLNKPNNIFFKELKTEKFLTSTKETGIFQIITTNKKYKQLYLLFFKENIYWIQDANDVSNCIRKIIEFTDKNASENMLKIYITSYLNLLDSKKASSLIL